MEHYRKGFSSSFPRNDRNDLHDGERVQGLVERVCVRLHARSRAMTLAPSIRGIAFAPGVGGVLMHEIVGHALEAD